MRIVIAEDSVLLRAGLTRLLVDAGEEVVASVGDAQGLGGLVDRLDPDVVVLDVRMPPTHTDEGIHAAIALRTGRPDVAVMVLSQYVERVYAGDLLAGEIRGLGYLLKDRVADVGDFLEALRRVAAGGTALDPEVVRELLARPASAGPLGTLTPRELDVLRLMAEGRSNTAIAERLVVTEGAVEKHVRNIFGKLGLTQDAGDHRRVLAVLRYLDR